jgi:hypothetical protein
LPVETRVRPMLLKLGDRLVDETGEYEVVGRPYTTAAGKNARVRVQRVDNRDVTMLRTWAAHERVTVRRSWLFFTDAMHLMRPIDGSMYLNQRQDVSEHRAVLE